MSTALKGAFQMLKKQCATSSGAAAGTALLSRAQSNALSPFIPIRKPTRSKQASRTMNSLVEESYSTQKSSNLYVKNFGADFSQNDLFALFAAFGTITSCVVMEDEYGNSKGFGFVAFEDTWQARAALAALNGAALPNGETLYVAEAQRKTSRLSQLETRFRTQQESHSIVVKHLAPQVDEAHLKSLFQEYGSILGVSIPDSTLGKKSRYAFVAFARKTSARRAAEARNASVFAGSTIFVEVAKTKDFTFVNPLRNCASEVPEFGVSHSLARFGAF